jgi:hypothetical protein
MKLYSQTQAKLYMQMEMINWELTLPGLKYMQLKSYW